MIVRRGVLRLERRMRQQREVVLGFDDLRRGLERGLDVADRPRRPVPAVAGGVAAILAAMSLHCVEVAGACSAAAVGPRSTSTFSVRRASLASHQLSATIATPECQRVVALARGLHDERVLDARQFLDLVEVGADRLAAEHRALLEDGVQRPFGRDVDAERGRPVTMSRLSTPRMRLPMILKSRGFLSTASAAARSGVGCVSAREASDAYVAVRFDAACFTMPLPVVSSLTGTFHCCAAAAFSISSRPPAPTSRMLLVVVRNRAAAAFRLRRVLRIQVRLLDRDLRPVDVELVGDDLRQRRLDALPRFRVLRDDGERVVGIDGDVSVRRERRAGAAGPPPPAPAPPARRGR